MKYILIILSFLFTSSLIGQNDVKTLELGQKQYYNSLAFDFNVAGSSKTNYKGGFGFRYAAGYKMNRWLNFGAGIGFEFLNFGNALSHCGFWNCNSYSYRRNNTLFIPLYAEVRGELTEWKVRPYYQMELGMGFKVKGAYDDIDNRPKGAYFRPQIGWKFKGKGDFAPSVGFGYLLQTSVEKRDRSWGESIYLERKKRKYQRYFIQFGFEF